MMDESGDVSDLLRRAAEGDQEALRDLFSRYRDRLKRMVHLRLSRRLAGRVDDSDVLQEAFLDVARRLDEYVREPSLPFFLWLRHMTGLKLAEVHRRHLGTQLRDADREVTLHRGGLPMADSVSLAAQLLGTLTTPSQAAIKAETRLLVQEALNSMDPIDREVLALKHFEQLSTTEIAEVLGLSKAGAGSRYLRAIKRLREILSQDSRVRGVLNDRHRDRPLRLPRATHRGRSPMSASESRSGSCWSWPRSSSTATAQGQRRPCRSISTGTPSWPPRSARSSRRWR